MGRQRSPDRVKAEKLYLDSKGQMKLIDIATQLQLPEGTIRGWKNKDKWDEGLNGTFQKNGTERLERSKRKLSPKQEKKEIQDKGLEEAELTEMQRLFCLYYIKSFNATLAAIKAGYAKESAHVEGSRLLRNAKVAAEIRRLKGEMQEEIFIDAMDVLNRYIKIAFADMTDFVEFGQEDVPVMGAFGPVETVNPISGAKEPLTQRVNAIHFKSSKEVDGGLICEISQGKQGTKIKLEDRQKALDKLAEYFDLFPDKFKRRIEEEKLKLASKRAGDMEPDEAEDDGFIEALKGTASEDWNDYEE